MYYIITQEQRDKLASISTSLHSGSDAMRDQGHRLWLVLNSMDDQTEAEPLIEAAPDMLAALRAIVDEAGPQFGHNEAPGTINRVSYLARAAISRATGV
jgi:hypothetical protein